VNLACLDSCTSFCVESFSLLDTERTAVEYSSRRSTVKNLECVDVVGALDGSRVLDGVGVLDGEGVLVASGAGKCKA